jgi:thymidylate synthase|tara:strand:+ start:308 stop:994 length:687 start_codon:yes stop_codon:yes gene_type:complete
MRQLTFKNASEAFDFYYGTIPYEGVSFAGTKAMFNQGFIIEKPWERMIDNEKREFNMEYAEAEWQWYLSGDRSIIKLGEIYGKIPQIWQRMANPEGEVNSNYGWQWERKYQLDKVVAQLKANPDTRQAAISIYDGKEIKDYKYDTPCTYAIQFTVVNNKLDMCVTMRSNDLWFGFCNDQYQFSKLQEMVSKRTEYEMGTYYHFAHNLHIYNDKLPEQNTLTSRARIYG